MWRRGKLYDARAADLFQLGLILFECMAGRALYSTADVMKLHRPTGGYLAMKSGKLKQHLVEGGLMHCFKRDAFALLEGLVAYREHKRLKVEAVIGHQWFKLYHQKYFSQLHRKCVRDAKQLKQHRQVMAAGFPFYRLQ